MRDILTGLAILLIVALSAALAGPYFIDWTTRRADFEQQLTRLAGVPVQISGPIDLKLLPTPRLKLEKVAATAPQGGPSLAIERLSLEIAVMPLLQGQIHVLEAVIEGPRLEAQLNQDGTIDGLGSVMTGMGSASAVAVERLYVTNGSIMLADRAGGRTLGLSDVDAEADAPALAGPWRANGRATMGGVPIDFRVATGSPEGSSTRLKLVVQSLAGTQRGEFDGRASVAAAGLQLDGRLMAGGRTRWPERDGFAERPWTFTAALKQSGRSGRLEAAELQAGGDESAIKFTGSGDLALGAAPSLSLNLESRQIDFDRPFAQPADAPQRIAPVASVFSAWLAALGQDERGVQLGVPVTVSARINNAIVGRETVSGFAADMIFASGRIQIAKLGATLPGSAVLDASGEAGLGDGGQFNGRVSLRSRDPARLAAWLEGEGAGRSARIGDIRELGLQADMALSPSVAAARNMRLTLDRSVVQGTMRYALPDQGGRPKFEAQLTADGLTVEQMPDISTLTAASRGLDVALTFEARNVRVGQASGPNIGAGRVGLKLAVTEAGVQIDTLDIVDVGGASMRATGRVASSGGRIEANIDARKVEPLAELLRKVVPGKLPALIADRAPTLGPLRVKLIAERGSGADGQTQFTIDGTAAASRITGSARIALAGGADRLVGNFRMELPDAAAFLNQMGLEALPLPGFGRGRMALDIDGRFGEGASVKLTGEAAGTSFAGEGRLAQGTDTDLTGSLSLDSADIGPLLQLLALPGPDQLGRVPASLKADALLKGSRLDLARLTGRIGGLPLAGDLAYLGDKGRMEGALAFERLSLGGLASLGLGTLQAPLPGNLWPSGRFGGVLPPPFESLITLKARAIDPGFGPAGSDATMTLRWTPDLLEVSKADAAFAGGRLGGGFTVRRQGGLATVSAKVTLQNASLAALLPQAGLAGQVTTELDSSGSGETVAALVTSLSGGGQMQLRNAALPRFDGQALRAVTSAFDAERDPPDLARVRDTLGKALDRGGLNAPAIEAPVTFSGGQVRIGPIALRTPGLDLNGTIGFDLRNARLDARATMVANPIPEGWSGPVPQATVMWRTGRNDIERDIDVALLTNVLTTRAVSRELERIEAAETDLRERSFFMRRVKAEREARERELREAEEARLAEEARIAEEARKAEEARRAEEARIAEVARKAEEARRAEEGRRIEEARRAEEARIAEENRIAEEARRAEDARKAELARRAEEVRRAEEARKEEARQAELARKAEEARRVEEARRAEEARRVEEARRAEEVRRAEEASRADEVRRAEDAIRAEEARRISDPVAVTGQPLLLRPSQAPPVQGKPTDDNGLAEATRLMGGAQGTRLAPPPQLPITPAPQPSAP